MSLKHFDWSFLFFRLKGSCRPYVRFSIFATADNVFRVLAERCTDLATRIFVAFEFNLETLVSEIVNPDSGIITRNKDLDFAVRIIWRKVDRLNACNFATLCIFAMRGPDMNLRLILQTFGLIEQTESV